MREIVEGAKRENRDLFEHEAKAIVRQYGIPVTKVGLAADEGMAVELAEEIGYPVVLKIVSPDVVHKSDLGGVVVELRNEKEVLDAYGTILKNIKKNKPSARITGILVQEYAPKGVEVIIGLIRDPQFGPTVMFGLGGVFVEVFKDVTFRVAPLSKLDAEEMINEIRGKPLLFGYRGGESVDVGGLREALIRAGQIGLENREISEMDLNPVMAYRRGIKVVDARIMLE